METVRHCLAPVAIERLELAAIILHIAALRVKVERDLLSRRDLLGLILTTALV